MPFDDETTDVLIGGYLSADAAHEDYEAVLHCGGYLARRRRRDQGPRRQPRGRANRSHGRAKAPPGLGAVGFAVGLFAPPLLAATAIGAAVGAVSGKALHKKTGSKIEEMAGETIPIGGAGLIVAYPHSAAGQGRARGDPCDPKGDRRSRGSPRQGPQGRARRRAEEDGPRKRVVVMTDRATDDRGAVVITGTSTGIGAACARFLAAEGFAIFAGVRREADAKAIENDSSGAMTPLMMDITDADMIATASQRVADAVGDRGLAGIVNNAGIVRPGPLEFQQMSEFREQLEVNLFGHLAVTQAFLPLIRQGKGRIVNVGSVGGRLVLPLHGGYSASKFAMEAVSDALRLELRQWGIHVSLVDPGGSKSAIFDKTLAAIDDMKQDLHDRDIEMYDAQIEAVRALVVKTADDAAPADHVARAVADALTAKKPKTRYLAGKDAKAVARARAHTP